MHVLLVLTARDAVRDRVDGLPTTPSFLRAHYPVIPACFEQESILTLVFGGFGWEGQGGFLITPLRNDGAGARQGGCALLAYPLRRHSRMLHHHVILAWSTTPSFLRALFAVILACSTTPSFLHALSRNPF